MNTSPMFMPEPSRESLMTASAKLRSRLDNPDKLLRNLQETLAALADIEFRYDVACERLGTCDGSEDWVRSLKDLEAWRERQRAPLIDKVENLQRKMLEQLG
jgi:hypothetical protein